MKSNNDKIWQNVIENFKETYKNIKPEDIDKWLGKIYILNIKNKNVTLIAPNKFVKNWVNDYYIDLLTDIFKELYFQNSSENLEVKVLLEENLEEKIISSENKIIEIKEDPYNSEIEQLGLPINRDYTFENFIVGDSNKFAHAVCYSTAEKFDLKLNPIYIYGDVGLGKTHLMQAVGNKVKTDNPKLDILYITGQNFTNQFINALKKGKSDDIINIYKKSDIFLFDDVEFIAGKEATMKQFFLLYEMLYSNNKPIIITSNSKPEDIEKMDQRLLSRFCGGLTVEITSPSVEEKIAIITKHLKTCDKEQLAPELVQYIAENIKSKSTRDLIGLINTMIVKADLLLQELSIDFIQKEYKDYFYDRNRIVTHDEIINLVADHFRIKSSDMKTKSRSKNILIPRNIAMYLIYKNTKNSLDFIGKIFDKDHSTVLNSVRNIEDLISKNDEFYKNIINTLQDKLKIEI